MSKTRIAVFEGMGRRRSSRRGYGSPLFNNRGPSMGFDPRTMPQGMGFDPRTMPSGMGSYGRRGYFVEPLYSRSSYGPATSTGRKSKKLKRKGYRVSKARNSAAQVRFKKAAKKCARVSKRRGSRKGSFQRCMKVALKKGRKSRR